MPYVSKAKREREGYVSHIEAADHICKVDGCDRKLAYRQLRTAGKYTEVGKDGEPHYKHNRRDIRPCTRVKLFHLMEPMYLDQLTMAGGEAVKILKRIKFGGLQQYRRRNGWRERRPWVGVE
jgi:hypothetical protein